MVAHRKLAGADDLYTARAANRQQARAGCGVVAHRKLAGADDLYIWNLGSCDITVWTVIS